MPSNEAPQWPQNFSPGSFGAPQEPQESPSLPPHSAQYRRSGRLALPQDGQRIVP